VLGVTPRNGDETVYRALKDRHQALAVYKSADLPARFGLAGHPRLPPIVGIAGQGWHITSTREMERWNWKDGTRRAAIMATTRRFGACTAC